jgi:hypothetical protein
LTHSKALGSRHDGDHRYAETNNLENDTIPRLIDVGDFICVTGTFAAIIRQANA